MAVSALNVEEKYTSEREAALKEFGITEEVEKNSLIAAYLGYSPSQNRLLIFRVFKEEYKYEIQLKISYKQDPPN